ncbi:MAG TPA: TonB-dependent receptor plug domain-containing protein [Gemmatimonas sp.]|nr:TonB-dependent receptor plug domain-containing protein [Gemmatimonas sp.]
MTDAIAFALLLAAGADSSTVCVRDASTGGALLDAQAVDSTGRSVLLAAECNRVSTGRWTIRRLGYEPRRVELSSQGGTVLVVLQRLSVGVAMLDSVRVLAGAAGADAGGVARTTVTTGVEQARERGIASVNGLIASMPYAAPRSARGESGLSLRGARREGVVITLDGLPLNDPATGTADVSDIPLVMLGSATVALGSDPMGAGPGASGGVLALHSATGRVLTLRGGAFGERVAEGGYEGTAGGARLAAALSYRQAENDFTFDNDAGASPDGSPTRERRVNNDERRGAVTLSAAGARAQALLLLSVGDRGMVGAANVRAYDADRSRTDRLLLRGQVAVGTATLVAGVRALQLGYRDPTRPVLDATSRAGAIDVEGRTSLFGLDARAGGGADRVTATGGIEQSRGRGFASLARTVGLAGARVEIGGRVDAVGSAGMQPSFNAAVHRRFEAGAKRSVGVGARVAQAIRVPSLYDLYFSSPQRLSVRALRPERVLLDAETNLSLSLPTTLGAMDLQGSLVARNTRDAIIWFPGNFGWSPANVGMERLRGGEARAALASPRSTLSVWTTAYHTNLSVGGLRIPTPYVARFAGGGSLLVHVAGSSGGAILRFNGRRPYTAGPRNVAFELPAVTLLDLSLSRRVHVGGSSALVALSLDNATGVRWQSVRGFPSPGRALAITLTLSPRFTP